MGMSEDSDVDHAAPADVEGLVERLRSWDHCWPAQWLEAAVSEAATALTELQAENERLRGIAWLDDPDTEVDGYVAHTSPNGEIWVHSSAMEDMSGSIREMKSRAEAAEAALAEMLDAETRACAEIVSLSEYGDIYTEAAIIARIDQRKEVGA